MHKAFGLMSVALLVALSPLARADEVVINGGFETEGPGGPTDSASWVQQGNGAPGTLSLRDSTSPHTGGFAQHLVAVGADGIGSTGILLQNSAATGGPSLQGGTTLSATFYGKVTLGPGGVGFYAIRILNRDGAIVADTGLHQMNDTGGAYQQFSMGPLTVPPMGDAPNDFYSSFVELVVSAGAFPESLAEAFIDDVSITGTLVHACHADFNGDGVVDFFDYLDFVDAFSGNLANADFNSDGVIDFFDYLDFVDAFSVGC